MGMEDKSLIDKINLTLVALTAMVIHHCLASWKTGEFRVPPEFGPAGGAKRMCNRRNINPLVNNEWRDVFHCLDEDFRSSLPEVPAKQIHNIRSIICERIHSMGTDPAMAQPHEDQGSFDEYFLDYVSEELIEQHDNSVNRVSSFVAATEASM